MAEWNRNTLTKAGIALLSKALAGEDSIVFTHVATGDGTHEESEDLTELTALGNQIQTFPFSAIEVENENTVHLKYIVSNVNTDETTLDAGYYVREAGIYARGASEEDSDAILYAVVTATEGKADWLAAYNGLQPATITTDWYTEVANADDVTIEGGTGAYALADDVNDLMERFLDMENMLKAGKIYTKSNTDQGYIIGTDQGKNIEFVRNVSA